MRERDGRAKRIGTGGPPDAALTAQGEADGSDEAAGDEASGAAEAVGDEAAGGSAVGDEAAGAAEAVGDEAAGAAEAVGDEAAGAAGALGGPLARGPSPDRVGGAEGSGDGGVERCRHEVTAVANASSVIRVRLASRLLMAAGRMYTGRARRARRIGGRRPVAFTERRGRRRRGP
ncbi:MAG TPA: hypothetical protein VFS00_21875, partial [Polyangiaceae bacterium]|nr:hypothetical protein [Polyangiaceae bacterium]